MRMKKIFSNNCGCNFVFYEIGIFQIVTLQGKLNRAGAVQISKIWKIFFSKIHLYTLCDIPPNDLGRITPKCIFWISLMYTYYFEWNKETFPDNHQLLPLSRCFYCLRYHTQSCALWSHTWVVDMVMVKPLSSDIYLEESLLWLQPSSPKQTAFIPTFSQVSATLPCSRRSPYTTGTW